MILLAIHHSRPRLLALAVLAALAVALALPGPARADGASANIRHAPGDTAEFAVAASGGYSLHFRSEDHILTVIVSRQGSPYPTISNDGRLRPASSGDLAASVYSLSGTPADPSRIVADLGPLGSVDLAFRPSGDTRVTTFDLADKTEGCVGAARVTRRLGTFTGQLSFNGEGGYTAVEATSARGTLGTSPRRNCHDLSGAGAAGRPAPPASALTALSLHGGEGDPSLFATVDAAGSHFLALAFHAFDARLQVVRIAQAVGPPAAFQLGAEARCAELDPPAPFSGAATYRDRPHAPTTWAGDLSVAYPGARLPRTGPQFKRPRLRWSAK